MISRQLPVSTPAISMKRLFPLKPPETCQKSQDRDGLGVGGDNKE